MKKIFLLITIFIIAAISNSQNDLKRGTFTIKRNAIFEFDRGENLFFANQCIACHTAYPYDKDERTFVTYLEKVTKKRTPSWIFSFMRYPELLLKSGDTAIVKINKKIKRLADMNDRFPFRQTHYSFHNLSLSDINAIFFYVDSLNSRKNNFKKGLEIDGHK